MLYKETEKIIEISRDTRKTTIKTTKDLVQAIKKRNVEQAKELMIKHIRNVRISLK